MNRLQTFGCSMTFGDYLPDCQTPNKNLASNYSWPTQLANKLDVPVLNKAISGSSNQRILDAIINSNYTYADLVVVLWTFKYRDTVFTPNGP